VLAGAAALAASGALAGAVGVAAQVARAGAQAPPVVLRVTKSENRNEVHYRVRVDERCVPVGDRPVEAYWVMRERGGGTEPLLTHEERAYGLGPQQVRVVREGRAEVRVALRALPERPLRVVIVARDGGCAAGAFTTVAGLADAQLDRVHVATAMLGVVDHVALHGHTSDGRTLVERLAP
jgi:hypothetical protein